MTKGVLALFHGIVGLGLSIVMWRLTGNVWAWAVLFSPASVLTVWGFHRVVFLGE
jgi:hypothetical protein